MVTMPAAFVCFSALALVALHQAGAVAGWWAAFPGEMAALLVLLLWAGSVLMVSRVRRVRPPGSAIPEHAVAVRPPAAAPIAVERRVHPRFPVDWSTRAEWLGAPPVTGRIRDVSRGGAKLDGVPQMPAGTVGILRIEGIALPVPCRVVSAEAGECLHIAFDLEGMGMEALLIQLETRIRRGATGDAGREPVAPITHM